MRTEPESRPEALLRLSQRSIPRPDRPELGQANTDSALAALLTALTGVSPTLAGSVFTWVGEARDGGWTDPANWRSLDPERSYPGDAASNDHVVIDDSSPRRQVVDNADLTLQYLFVGHGHEVILNSPIVVTSQEPESGIVRFEGAVTLSGDSAIRAKGILVNSKSRSTTITMEQSATIVTE